MNDFTIYPAIDLRQGHVVRLRQGDPERQTTYADGALGAARRWQAAGASWLHVVNLDGAFGETGRANGSALARILSCGINVQCGGGMRSLETIQHALDMGVQRVVLGTIAVENPALLREALARFGAERIVVGIDARDGKVHVHGWKSASALSARELAFDWAEMGGRWLIFTDIARDGMGSGTNIVATAALAEASGLQVISSGGVDTLADVRRVRDAGLRGVIVGRALYEGHLDLTEALALQREPVAQGAGDAG